MTSPDQLMATVDETVADLSNPATPLADTTRGYRPLPQSLAGGAAGVALLQIERAFHDLGQWDTAHAWLSAAASGDLNGGTGACLFFGVPALAFLTSAAAQCTGRYQRALTRLDNATTAITQTRLDAAHARIDRGERPSLAEFDLIRGLTGLGAYHLRHDPHHETTAAVLAYLVRLTEPLPGDDGLPGWWTDHGPTGQPPPDYPGGHGNFGMAHGITGPLALLALGLRQGIVVDGHTTAIARICAWLDIWRQHAPAGRWWPRTITLGEARTGRCQQAGPLQPSWCYGTPGITRAQQLAALATGDTARQLDAEAALLGCLNDPGQLARINNPSLCHGAAGLLHTTWHTGRDAATSDLTACLPQLTRLLLDKLRDPASSTEFLEGRIGAALALHTAAVNASPQSRWDACLLLT